MEKFLKDFFNQSFKVQVLTIVGILMVISFCMCNAVHAETEIKREGNQFTQVSSGSRSQAKETEYTWRDLKTGKVYQVYICANGRCYVNRISQKTGNPYRYYIDEEIAKTICSELGVEYTYVKKSRK